MPLPSLYIHNARVYAPVEGVWQQTATELFVKDGKVCGKDALPDDAQRIDAQGALLLPGFVDCHTHILYAGNRADEYEMRLEGKTYQEIAQAGGGILSTVKAVRDASEEELIQQTLPRLNALMASGVTRVEIKSGYGLSTEAELKMLRAINKLKDMVPMHIHSTFLGAHAFPPDIDKETYIQHLINDMLPTIAKEDLADTCDIYIENIAYTLAQATEILNKAAALGLNIRIHGEQFTNMGATALGAAYKALSSDHLEYTSEQDVQKMKAADMTAVILPGAFYFLRETQLPPIEALRTHGVPVALATDMNPGSSPICDMQIVMHLAGVLFKMRVDEILSGVTHYGAKALGIDAGHLNEGTWADFTLWHMPAPNQLVYQFGGVKPHAMYIKGEHVI